MAEPSRAPNPIELIAAFIEQGRDFFTYSDLNQLLGVDVQTTQGRARFYRERGWLLNERRVWLQNVSGKGYRVVRQGAMIDRAAQRKPVGAAERREKLRKNMERARNVRKWRSRVAKARDAENARQAVETLRAAEPAESEETARAWVNGRRGLPPPNEAFSLEIERKLPGLEFGREALERVTQAALSQVYREVARTLVEMAERYAKLAEQALAGMK